MSDNSELTTQLAVLHFVVHHLMVVHCEGQEDPVASAQKLLADIEKAFADAPKEQQWQVDMQRQMKEFFAQVVSTLRSKTSHHDA